MFLLSSILISSFEEMHLSPVVFMDMSGNLAQKKTALLFNLNKAYHIFVWNAISNYNEK